METAEVQLDVIEEGIDELCSLESYMQRTHPPDESATLLAVKSALTRNFQEALRCICPVLTLQTALVPHQRMIYADHLLQCTPVSATQKRCVLRSTRWCASSWPA